MIGIIAQGFSICGSTVAIASYQFKKNVHYFLMNALCCTLFATSFFLMGSVTAALFNLINVLRSFTFAFLPKKYFKLSGAVMILLYTSATVFTYDGILSLFILIAQLAATFVMALDNGKFIRLTQIGVVSPIWLVHNFIVFTIGGIITEVFSIISVGVSIYRYGLNGFTGKDE